MSTTLKTRDLALCAEISENTVREYSNQGLITPVVRSENSGYRSFDPRLVSQVQLIKTLRELGYGPQQMKEYGQSRTPETTLEMFHDCCFRLNEDIMALQARKDMLQSYITFIEEGQAAKSGEIALRALPEQPIRTSVLKNHNLKKKNMERLRSAIGQIRHNGNVGCPMGFAYRDFFDLLEHPEQPAQLVSYDPQGPEVRPAGEYLIGTMACHNGENNGLAKRMFSYALDNEIELDGTAYAVYLLDVTSVADEGKYLLQIVAGIRITQEVNR